MCYNDTHLLKGINPMNDVKEALNVTVGLIAMTMIVYGTVRIVQGVEQGIHALLTKKKKS